ncbi:arylsulfatase [Eudoraea chungangensis]|uniref:arylsulfatase n=1 Tax=Eudoraea chungangensis TaxID=1481905 RepID=UPI0023ECA6FF|nr:arylsulfatase [Eudoraea chungangensis]
MRLRILTFGRFAIFYTIVGLLGCSGSPPSTATKNNSSPNILLIVADDLGYADLGCYGSDIHTPNIDLLASEGIRFSRFYNAPMCAPTRAMLLTGNDNHIAGVGRQAVTANVFGYEGRLMNRVVTVPQLLQESGYHTYMAGKWHLGNSEEANPNNKGFEHSYVMLEGVGNHYSEEGIFKGIPKSHYTEDGQITNWPKDAYSTNLYTDKLISYIDKHKEDKRPFFAYAAFTSPHWPLQVDKKYSDKYTGRYDQGYEALKRERFTSLMEAGMIPKDAKLPPNHPLIKPWSALNETEKKVEAKKMELYAGMLDNLDENIGRLIAYLKDIGEYQNTVIIFMSDNGAAGEDYYNDPEIRPYISGYYSNSYENMGKANSMVSYGPQWAEAGSSPFRYYKAFTTNGGMISPIIIRNPVVKGQNTISHSFTTVMDLAPTIYEWAGIEYPTYYDGNRIYPLKGSSLVPVIEEHTAIIHDDDYVFGMEHSGYAMIRKGNWKITNSVHPFKEANFELFNLEDDLGEIEDLKAKEQKKYSELIEEWRLFTRETRAQLPR